MKTVKVNVKGKGSQEEQLPHRFALTQLTKGDPMQRTMNNYAKATPSIDQGTPGTFGAPAKPFP